MGTSGPGLNAFRDVYQYHDLQRQSVARSVYEQAIRRVTDKVKSGHVTTDLWDELGEPRHD